MIFEIINHSYKYHRLLAYQMSSLCLYKTKQKLIYTVLYDPQDIKTVQTIEYFKDKLLYNVTLNRIEMDIVKLVNRGYGRDLVARNTVADWVWFTDTDYVYQNVCFDDLAEKVEKIDADMVWPSIIYETDWDTGKKLMDKMNECHVEDVPSSCFVTKNMPFAIGGVQIARGSYVRNKGYAISNRDNFLKHRFIADIIFRRSVEKRVPITLDRAVRIRHEYKGDELKNNETTN